MGLRRFAIMTLLIGLAAGTGHCQAVQVPAIRTCKTWVIHGDSRYPAVSQRIVRIINSLRRLLLLPIISPNKALDRVAQTYAKRLAAAGMLQHTGPAGDTIIDRLHTAGLDAWNRAGENLARDSLFRYRSFHADGTPYNTVCHSVQTLSRDIVRGWVQSPGHLRNLLDGLFDHVGTGFAIDLHIEAIVVVQVYIHAISCGYKNAPCCHDSTVPHARFCIAPYHCRAETCQ